MIPPKATHPGWKLQCLRCLVYEGCVKESSRGHSERRRDTGGIRSGPILKLQPTNNHPALIDKAVGRFTEYSTLTLI